MHTFAQKMRISPVTLPTCQNKHLADGRLECYYAAAVSTFQGSLTRIKLVQLHFGAHIVDVDTDKISFRIVIKHNALRDYPNPRA